VGYGKGGDLLDLRDWVESPPFFSFLFFLAFLFFLSPSSVVLLLPFLYLPLFSFPEYSTTSLLWTEDGDRIARATAACHLTGWTTF
jgi:hypothetical protein